MDAEIQWYSDGIKINSDIHPILSEYSDENNFFKIIRLNERIIAITDEIGSVFKSLFILICFRYVYMNTLVYKKQLLIIIHLHFLIAILSI